MHRFIIPILAIALIIPMGIISGAAAQEATPTSGFDDLGLPTLEVTVLADQYEGIPDTLEAGRYLVTVNASEDVGEFGGGVSFIQPSGITVDEFLEALRGMSEDPESDGAAGTPDTDPAAAESPVAVDGEEDAVPDFFFTSRHAGGVGMEPGESAQVVLDLTPGEWVAWGDEPSAPWEPVRFEVTGEMPADLLEPDAGAVLTMGEYFIDVTEGQLTTGTQIVRVDNVGAQPHFVIAGRSTVDVTEQDILAVLESDMTGTPAAVDFDPDRDFEDAFFTGTQSTGTSMWIVADLSAGPHILICFFPDLADGMPHAYHGMFTIVDVTD